MVYTRDSVFYSLQITDRSKLAAFYERIKNEVDSTTNDFKKKGVINKILSKNRKTFSSLNDNEKSLMRLAFLLNKLDTGIQLICTELKKESKSVTVYSIIKEEKNYKPIKCD